MRLGRAYGILDGWFYVWLVGWLLKFQSIVLLSALALCAAHFNRIRLESIELINLCNPQLDLVSLALIERA